jgi:hypothetical protein
VASKGDTGGNPNPNPNHVTISTKPPVVPLLERTVGTQPTLSKWFYDTFIGAATEAVHCGFFIGESFSLLVISYG